MNGDYLVDKVVMFDPVHKVLGGSLRRALQLNSANTRRGRWKSRRPKTIDNATGRTLYYRLNAVPASAVER